MSGNAVDSEEDARFRRAALRIITDHLQKGTPFFFAAILEDRTVDIHSASQQEMRNMIRDLRADPAWAELLDEEEP